MKKLKFLLIFCCSFITILCAQIPPAAFTYSAVARNAQNIPISNKNISIQISILKSTPTGNDVYKENHTVSTDQFGLFNLVVGGGAIQSGSISNIDWSNDKYFIKVGMDVNGGTNFSTMGVTQLLSVPYAMYAKSAGGMSNSGGNFTHFIGEEFGGGVIFHLWKDQQGVEHGLIVDKTDLSSSLIWSNATTNLGDSARDRWDGSRNSNAIVNQAGHTTSAAALCLNSVNGGQNDWYLPAQYELQLLFGDNYYSVKKAFEQIPNATKLADANYWSSNFFFGESSVVGYSVTEMRFISAGSWNTYRVRAIRAF